MTINTIASKMTGNRNNKMTVFRLFRQIWVWIPTYFITGRSRRSLRGTGSIAYAIFEV